MIVSPWQGLARDRRSSYTLSIVLVGYDLALEQGWHIPGLRSPSPERDPVLPPARVSPTLFLLT